MVCLKNKCAFFGLLLQLVRNSKILAGCLIKYFYICLRLLSTIYYPRTAHALFVPCGLPLDPMFSSPITDLPTTCKFPCTNALCFLMVCFKNKCAFFGLLLQWVRNSKILAGCLIKFFSLWLFYKFGRYINFIFCLLLCSLDSLNMIHLSKSSNSNNITDVGFSKLADCLTKLSQITNLSLDL
jgi:hypothetical protein